MEDLMESSKKELVEIIKKLELKNKESKRKIIEEESIRMSRFRSCEMEIFDSDDSVPY